MSKQRKHVSSTQNDSFEDLSLGICEELKKRKNEIDDGFVWVDMHEDLGSICQSSLYEINTKVPSIIMRPGMEYASSKEEPSDQSDCDSDLPEDEEIEAQYIDKCAKEKEKSYKQKYPKPYWMKIYERGIYGIEKRDRENIYCSEQSCELLPKMIHNASTTRALEHLINYKFLGEINELIYNGKKTIVFHAYCSRFCPVTVPSYLAVKIYKTSKVKEENKIIYRQVQKEFEHLKILNQSKTLRNQSLCPVRTRKNVILMGFFGNVPTEVVPIEDFLLKHNQVIKTVYNIVVDYIDKCFNIANLIHGNLSAKNILCWTNLHKITYEDPRIIFTGWSQSVIRKDPMAFLKLKSDCNFVMEYFNRKGVADKSAIGLFQYITRHEKVEGKLSEITKDEDLFHKYDTNPNRRSTSPAKPSTNKRFK